MKHSKASFRDNASLLTLPIDGWRGNPVDERGRFFNPDYPFIPALADHLKWVLTPNEKKAEKKRDSWRVPVVRDDRFWQDRPQDDVLVWLGHASFYLRLSGVSILIDPIFGGFPGIPRRSEPPFLPEDFDEIDLVLVSHNHRDHCDKRAVQKIAKAFPKAQFLTGLGTDSLLRKWTKKAQVQGAGWYQKFETSDFEIEIYFLPARHWTRRWVFDTNRDLWGAFVIRTPEQTIYFSGDTGYGRHFEEAGRLFPNIDTAIIGVGTYTPSFVSSMHINPEDAVRGLRDLGAKTLIPMHFGTFDLSDEPFGEPLRRLKDCAPAARLRSLAVGENHFLTARPTPKVSMNMRKDAATFFHSN